MQALLCVDAHDRQRRAVILASVAPDILPKAQRFAIAPACTKGDVERLQESHHPGNADGSAASRRDASRIETHRTSIMSNASSDFGPIDVMGLCTRTRPLSAGSTMRLKRTVDPSGLHGSLADSYSRVVAVRHAKRQAVMIAIEGDCEQSKVTRQFDVTVATSSVECGSQRSRTYERSSMETSCHVVENVVERIDRSGKLNCCVTKLRGYFKVTMHRCGLAANTIRGSCPSANRHSFRRPAVGRPLRGGVIMRIGENRAEVLGTPRHAMHVGSFIG